jgi:antitoxin VapB
MALQIANPVVIHKVTELARITGLTKTAAVEEAVDEMLRTTSTLGASVQRDDQRAMMMRLLRKFDRAAPSLEHGNSDIVWDDNGLPT